MPAFDIDAGSRDAAVLLRHIGTDGTVAFLDEVFQDTQRAANLVGGLTSAVEILAILLDNKNGAAPGSAREIVAASLNGEL